MSENKNMIFECDFPTWALGYLFNDDTTGLSVREIETIEEWKEHKEFFSIEDNASEYFSKYPAFGKWCTCVELKYRYDSDFEIGE